MKILNNIQFLRGFAAINVVFFHLLGYTFENTQFKGFALNFINGWGQNGVDLFFVISGFIMVYVQKFKQRSTRIFLLDRAIRIIPSYWILTLILGITSFIFAPLFKSIIFDFQHLLLSFLFLSQPVLNTVPFVMVGWTLEFEVLFYLIFGISLFIKNNLKSLFLNVILIFLIAVAFKQYIIIEFLYGILVGVIFLRYDLSKYAVFFLLGGFVLLFISLGMDTGFSATYRFIIWGIPAFLIVLGAVYLKQMNGNLVKILGDISYSTYLLHYLMIPLLYKIFAYLGFLEFSTPILNDLLAIVICVIILGVSYIYFRLIEKPVTNYLKEKFLFN